MGRAQPGEHFHRDQPADAIGNATVGRSCRYDCLGRRRGACVGDCDETGGVAIDDIITLVSIALSIADPSACAPRHSERHPGRHCTDRSGGEQRAERMRALMADRMKAGVTILLLLGLGWTQAGAFEAPRRGLGAGPVEVLAIDPHTPTTIYAVAACGGAWKSIDGGDSWSTANSGLSEFVYDSSTQLLIDPATPRILYIRAHSGLFKSTNAGDSWQAAGGDLRPKVFLHRINHRTGDPRHALRRRRRRHQRPDQRRVQEHGRREQLATGAQRLCRSAVSHRAARRRPHAPSTLYAGVSGVFGVYKSDDGARTWYDANIGLPPAAAWPLPSLHHSYHPLPADRQWNLQEHRRCRDLADGDARPVLPCTYELAVDPTMPAHSTPAPERAGRLQKRQRRRQLACRPTTACQRQPHRYRRSMGRLRALCMPYRSHTAASSRAPRLPVRRSHRLSGSAICGDGVLCGGGEECEDGNLLNGDGCSFELHAGALRQRLPRSAWRAVRRRQQRYGDGCAANCARDNVRQRRGAQGRAVRRRQRRRRRRLRPELHDCTLRQRRVTIGEDCDDGNQIEPTAATPTALADQLRQRSSSQGRAVRRRQRCQPVPTAVPMLCQLPSAATGSSSRWARSAMRGPTTIAFARPALTSLQEQCLRRRRQGHRTERLRRWQPAR